MNEEHDPKQQNPGTASFAVSIGDRQRHGDHVLGVPPSMADVPVGIAPPEPLQVVSIFDTRPISAYDFCFNDFGIFDPGEVDPIVVLEAPVPPGYTAALRRLEIEFTPNGIVNLDAAGIDGIQLQLLRNGSPIPHCIFFIRGAMDDFVWPTHQVFGADDVMGLQMVGTYAIPAGDPVIINANFMGVLIPTKSKPPETEIASPAVLTQTLDEWKDEVKR
jgi:hypothetical protein